MNKCLRDSRFEELDRLIAAGLGDGSHASLKHKGLSLMGSPAPSNQGVAQERKGAAGSFACSPPAAPAPVRYQESGNRSKKSGLWLEVTTHSGLAFRGRYAEVEIMALLQNGIELTGLGSESFVVPPSDVKSIVVLGVAGNGKAGRMP